MDSQIATTSIASACGEVVLAEVGFPADRYRQILTIWRQRGELCTKASLRPARGQQFGQGLQRSTTLNLRRQLAR
jgi:hypothetical protein